jgi:enoyl-CoA hydratase
MKYDLPDELTVTADGAIRIVTMNRPDVLNAINDPLHHALTRVWMQITEDQDARVVILTGAGRAFSAGGDAEIIDRCMKEPMFRRATINDARRIVTEMVAFPLPVVAAVNGPAVGLGASIAVLSDIVLMGEKSFMSDPHVNIGLVAADGGSLTWPLLTSLLRAKEYLLTGKRLTPADAERFGLCNRVVPNDQLMDEAKKVALELAAQPRQALEDTKRILNVHLSRAVYGVIDFALAAESTSFDQPGFAERVAGFNKR